MTRYMLTATDGDNGERLGQHVTSTPPNLAVVEAFARRYVASYVAVHCRMLILPTRRRKTTLYARDEFDTWSVIALDVDDDTAAEARRWHHATHHNRPPVNRHAGLERRQVNATHAISLVVRWIRAHGMDYPTEGLVADRFEVGWSVYAPVDVDDSDPMAFLDMPVGRSVFLVGDSGRIKEVSTSVPPQQARDQFIEEE